MSIKIML